MTNEPDDSTADRLISLVGYLRDLFARNSGLIGLLTDHEALDPSLTCHNVPPVTIMDAFILFCHMPKPKRVAFINKLQGSTVPTVLAFSETLASFNVEFIRPIEKACKKELGASYTNPKYSEVTSLTASRLIPLITLLLDGYGIDVDTPMISKYILEHPETDTTLRVRTAQDQIHFINQSASPSGASSSFYKRQLSPFVHVSSATSSSLDDLLEHQYRMTQVTKLLDGVSELVDEDRDFLQQQLFVTFLLKCVEKVKDEYVSLSHAIDQLDKTLVEDELVPLNLKLIMRSMDIDIGKRLVALKQATSNIKQVVGAPDFINQQKQVLTGKINHVMVQFTALFGESSGLEGLIPGPLDANPTQGSAGLSAGVVNPPISNMVDSNKIVALSQLVHSCLDGLSYLSQQGYKGVLLRGLARKIDDQSNFTIIQFNRAIRELVRLTASYSETIFFQAAYSRTRSANILIKAIKDPGINNLLSLSTVIFGPSVTDYATLSDDHIAERIAIMGRESKWEASACLIKPIALF